MTGAAARASGENPLFRTVVVDGPLALRMARLTSARAGEIGLQVLTLPQLAARLAGGFIRPVQREELEPAIGRALAQGGLPDLAPVQDMPGMVRALARTLERLWLADTDVSLAGGGPRLADLGRIDRRVREILGPGVLPPPDLVAAALQRADLTGDLLGPVSFEHIGWIPPVWRPLIAAIGERTTITGLEADGVATGAVVTGGVWMCADPHAEVVEALRWARALVASRRALPSEVAIAAAAPETWDAAMQSLAASADLPVHFSHGVSILTTVDGQACAALAELLGQGLSQERVRRWLAHSAGRCPGLEGLPENALAGLRIEAHLRDRAQWTHALDLAEQVRLDGARPSRVLGPALDILSQGWPAAAQAGELFLPRSAARVWRAALRAAPAEALIYALGALRVSDGTDPGNSIAWCPASHLAGAPRRFVRLLGLTAGGWPRALAADPLLPDHILALDKDAAPTRPDQDRRAFAAITRHAEVVACSFAKRTAQGGLQAPSPLLPAGVAPTQLVRQRIPEHAFSDTDRLAARPAEARKDVRQARALACWQARRSADVNAHDGVVGADHPIVQRALAGPQSPTRLRRLLRDPLGFVWRHGLGWRSTVFIDQPLDLDPRAFGDLVHLLLQRTVTRLEPDPGFGRASVEELEAALEAAGEAVAASWPLERPAPPPLLWRYTLEHARAVALRALRLDPPLAPGTRSWTEVRFGDAGGGGPGPGAPWDPRIPVPLPGTELTIRGAIDRLELDGADLRADVTDYKTGAVPRRPEGLVLGGGTELQRVLYAAAVAHHRPEARRHARLVFLAEASPRPYPLEADTLEAALAGAVRHLNAGVALARSGVCLPGPDDPWETWNAQRIALPAAGEPYRQLKRAAFGRAFGDFAAVWRAP